MSESSNQSRDGNVQLCIGQARVYLSHVRRYLRRLDTETSSPSPKCSDAENGEPREIEGLGSVLLHAKALAAPFREGQQVAVEVPVLNPAFWAEFEGLREYI